MAEKLVITKYRNVKLGLFYENGILMDVRCYEASSLVGNVYVGRVSNILDNIGAVFVDIKRGESCYLPLEECAKRPSVGELLTVQVTKDPVGKKRPVVSACISLHGEYSVVWTKNEVGISQKIEARETRERLRELFQGGLALFLSGRKCEDQSYGGIMRTAAAEADPEDLLEEQEALLSALDDLLFTAKKSKAYTCLHRSVPECIPDMEALFKRREEGELPEIVTDIASVADECASVQAEIPVRFEESTKTLHAIYQIDRTLERLLSPRVYLKSGAWLMIERTEALTVADVNSGKAVRGKDSEEEILKINLEAAYELARQLRLRNVGGIILADFISMKSETARARLLESLAEATAADRVRVTVHDITRLGLVELTRQKIHRPLAEVFSEKTPGTETGI